MVPEARNRTSRWTTVTSTDSLVVLKHHQTSRCTRDVWEEHYRIGRCHLGWPEWVACSLCKNINWFDGCIEPAGAYAVGTWPSRSSLYKKTLIDSMVTQKRASNQSMIVSSRWIWQRWHWLIQCWHKDGTKLVGASTSTTMAMRGWGSYLYPFLLSHLSSFATQKFRAYYCDLRD